MKRTLFALAPALVLGLACSIGWAQTNTLPRTSVTLASAWDLDGEAADDDQIVVSADLADSTTYALAAQPDICRLVAMTVTDANSSVTAGTVTVTGTDCLGYSRICTFDFSVVATRGSGVKTLPVTTGPPGSSCYLGAVTSVVTSVLATEAAGTDLLKVGYTSNSVTGWPMYGALKTAGANGEHGVDPSGFQTTTGTISTTGSSTTVEASVATAFDGVSVGDLILFTVGSTEYQRIVATKTDGDTITVNLPVNIATGVNWAHKKFYFSTDPTDDMSFDVRGLKTAMLTWSVAANADTGGVQLIVEGTRKGAGWPSGNWVPLCPTSADCSGVFWTVATGGTLTGRYESLILDWMPFTNLRFGWKFGTGDDADGAPESISAGVSLR